MGRLVFSHKYAARDYLKALRKQWKIKNRCKLTEIEEAQLLADIMETEDYLRKLKNQY